MELKYKEFKDNKVNFLTFYKEDALCNFINENNIKQNDIQNIYIDSYRIQLFYWEE